MKPPRHLLGSGLWRSEAGADGRLDGPALLLGGPGVADAHADGGGGQPDDEADEQKEEGRAEVGGVEGGAGRRGRGALVGLLAAAVAVRPPLVLGPRQEALLGDRKEAAGEDVSVRGV